MDNKIYIIFAVIAFVQKVNSGLLDCRISPYGNLSPIVVLHNQNEFLYPEFHDLDLRFPPGTSVDFLCPGGEIIIGSNTYTDISMATCIVGSLFEIHSQHVDFNDITCSRIPDKNARYTGLDCENNGKEIEIGFETSNNFLRTVLVCFDQSTQLALHTRVNITRAINKRVTSTPRPSFIQGRSLYSITSVNSYYTRVNQRTTINNQLGLPAESTQYINTNTYYLARGHMTARSDNFYPSEQNSTFFFVNAAPQWQIFNAGNWYKVEISVRDYAEANDVDLIQWTGVYGVLTLPDSRGHPTELYIYDVNGVKNLPVPEIFWKVVYDPISLRGIAIIGLNNPYAKSYTVFCDDVSDQIDWIHVAWDSVPEGLIYACEIEDFKKTVSYVPSFPVSGLLV
ncbi:uncharacterized protein LOC115884504 [Sitophilus oryzae]|uniref:Uncharacterized protein LOC115884504 n=1 Tax=Sitophilus oryzae TaxID=7048 RepID=A0A6J2Y6W6_SITOR|nr:uncharacterized protein LOC115884504 [Sitophilus oryzae]